MLRDRRKRRESCELPVQRSVRRRVQLFPSVSPRLVFLSEHAISPPDHPEPRALAGKNHAGLKRGGRGYWRECPESLT